MLLLSVNGSAQHTSKQARFRRVMKLKTIPASWLALGNAVLQAKITVKRALAWSTALALRLAFWGVSFNKCLTRDT